MKIKVKDYLITGLGGVIMGSNIENFDFAHILIGFVICVVGIMIALDD